MEAIPAVSGGFADPVFDSQTVFRAVMDAMARPGRVMPLPLLAGAPAPLSPRLAAVALTLCDHDTPLWLDPALAASQAVRDWLGFHAGAPFAQVPAEAHFAFVSNAAELMAIDNFAQGSQEYPDRSTTLVLDAGALSAGCTLTLQGPGIDGFATLSPAVLPRHFVEQWKGNNQRFPRGVDVVLAGVEGIACLPRTTRLSLLEG